MPPPLPITLIVITRNEARALATCLDSVDFVAEKLVIDSGSVDDTVAIATAHGARVVTQPWLGFGPQRNFATTQASHEWIIVLDADEQLSPALAQELRERLPALIDSQLAGGVFKRSAHFMGRAMRWYRPMARERIARLYHRQRARWTQASVHESLRFDAPVITFKHLIQHDHNPTLAHRQLKMLRYTELRIQDWQKIRRPVNLWLCPVVFVTTFFKDYFLRLAFLDGWRGYIVAHIAASYAVYKRIRYYEATVSPVSVAQAKQLFD